MPSQINASNSGFGGIVSTGDSSGVLELQTTGTTAVTIDTSQRVGFVAGTAAAPAITRTGDTNTGIFYPAADTIAFAEGGTESMRLDSNGNVGIGTTSPTALLDVYGTQGRIKLDPTSTSGATVINFVLQNNSNFADGVLGASNMRFNTAGTERMRINSSGTVLVGTTTPIIDELLGVDQTAASRTAILAKAATTGTAAIRTVKVTNVNNSTQLHLAFAYNNGANGNGAIAGNGDSQAAFATFSDSRLKKNIEDLPSQLDKINALRPVEFDYIKSGEHQIGFVAQEVREVYPDLVAEGEDEMLTVIGLGKTEARLIKAIQEQQTIINDLKARIETLEAK